MNHSFNQEQVEGLWINMCMRMQNIKELIGLANRMKAVTPTITEFPNIEVVVDNQLLLNDILDIKNRIRPTFVQGLHNDQIQIDYRLAQSDEIKRFFQSVKSLTTSWIAILPSREWSVSLIWHSHNKKTNIRKRGYAITDITSFIL